MYRILILVVFSNLCSFCLYCILCNIIAIVSTCNFCFVFYFFLSTSNCFVWCKLILFGKYCSHCTVSIVSIVTFVNKCCVLGKKKKKKNSCRDDVKLIPVFSLLRFQNDGLTPTFVMMVFVLYGVN